MGGWGYNMVVCRKRGFLKGQVVVNRVEILKVHSRMLGKQFLSSFFSSLLIHQTVQDVKELIRLC